ncbi:hypothetical protein Ahy_B05g076317 [Arachis hypogaea]|uniref:Protein FAR1-RELATED SEQUENCE n=1 Tax=Arachis hypogaea TaxID=3818 RepID=A0A444Z3F4_ARAHY|nr:hypothetical protein Ahy_B05g076317 [Arachis hypogaea]
MESFGILCEQIVKVLVNRDICEIPQSLVLGRWTKKVKSTLNDASGFARDVVVISRQSVLMEFYKELAAVAARGSERFEETHDIIMGSYSSYKAADEGSGQLSKKKRQRCSVCSMKRHKKTTCPWQKDIDNVMENEADGSDDGDTYTELIADLDSDN